MGPILDPACGWGHVLGSASSGYEVLGSDVVDRRRSDHVFVRADFIRDEQHAFWDRAGAIVCNPPFDQFELFVARALAIRASKVAFIWQTRRLNAAHWLRETPLRRVLYLTPRPSMPTGDFILKVQRGEHDPKTGKPLTIGGGTADYCWLIWEKSYKGLPSVGWLHRDE